MRNTGVTRDTAAGWAPYLDPGELLLWDGAPARGIRFEMRMLGQSAFGLFFLGFALFWMAGASGVLWGNGGGGPPDVFAYIFPLFGLPFVAVGAWMVFGHILWDAWVRSRTRYALTNRRAIIASQTFARSLKSWPIDANTELDYRPGSHATLYFAEETRVHRGRRRTRLHAEPIGFRFIADGDHVYQLFRSVQRGDA